jgi:hypothetical protein
MLICNEREASRKTNHTPDDYVADFDVVALLAARFHLTRSLARVVVEHLRGGEAD